MAPRLMHMLTEEGHFPVWLGAFCVFGQAVTQCKEMQNLSMMLHM